MGRIVLKSSCALLALLPTLAQADPAMQIDIPAQPLAQTITELGQKTGLNVSVSQELVADRISPAVKGSMTSRQALTKLLADTGLRQVDINEGNAAVTRNFVSQNATDDPFDLGTLVLQEELIDRAVQDSQTSVAVTTGEELERRNIARAIDIINQTANATGAFGDEAISILGIQERGIGNAGLGRTVATTVDGARLSDFGARTDIVSTWDLEQVEVLRGPQSTQSGRNALAGAVIFRSRDPEFSPEYRLRLGYGENDTRQASFVLNTPLVEDRLAFRLSGDFRQTDGDIYNPARGVGDYDFSDETHLRASLRWEPTDQFSAILKYTYSDYSDVGRATVDKASFLAGSRVNLHDVNGFSNRELRSTNLRLNYAFTSALSLESETTFTEWDREGQTGHQQPLSLP